ncbi:uncharacterized protein CIMG_09749 [Coccidioides immitis RS]|uniref:Uncharacterized protein n=4 Tax=Coccidioides immitis TaxID=5501 RepID=J3K326_COCIM|nr:uncharacterized protein CIMG_09749 [Coccidioides immitis RS]KMP02665.1 hypothetical protein CIRG_02357 [Coccidioides immitis RMSCC 2394]KMU74602.1 hypothetical protein CISG_04309 [Coccidioides immitis RMSCC 3703]KMU89700.1 hypothetical protein CIHG_07507 [Coccidioides immitis H538.4]TPX23162.1 hypothetical protein DIZ76_012487 [Coccidioides immitis]EAS28545.3 hypothetical protein CIMG_09749 [Coccidioides immitis RS]
MRKSHVGNPSLYEDGDQRNSPQSELRAAQRNRDHPPASSGRGSAHSKEQQARKGNKSPTDEDLAKKDPLAPATFHGNKPSRGAQIDAELRREDEERLRQKEGK